MRIRIEPVPAVLGGPGTALVVGHPDGGCTVIAECGDLHAVFRVSAWGVRQMRYQNANRRGARNRKPRSLTTERPADA